MLFLRNIKKIFLFAFCLAPLCCQAWVISPTIVTVTPGNPQTFFYVVSDEESPIAIEIYACDREIDLEGKESEIRNKKDFIIYPSHIILQPNQKRMIRVIWKGDRTIDYERAYRIVAESVPVDFMKGTDPENKVNFLIKMGTQSLCSFYVAPKSVVEKIQYEVLDVQNDENGTFFNIIFENTGTKHAILKDYGIQIQAQEKFFQYNKEAFSKFLENGFNLLPLHKRKVRVALPDSFVTGPIKIRLIAND